jgi:hypothetical protein
MSQRSFRATTATLFGYVLWGVSSVLGIAVALVLRKGLIKLYVLLRPSPWTIAVTDKITVVGVILAWIVLAILCEQYYVDGAQKGKLLRRFTLVTISSLIVVGVGYALGLLSL